MTSFILPSLFGATFAMMAMQKFKIALYALPIAMILRSVPVPEWVPIVGSIFGTIAITYGLYKKNLIK